MRNEDEFTVSGKGGIIGQASGLDDPAGSNPTTQPELPLFVGKKVMKATSDKWYIQEAEKKTPRKQPHSFSDKP